MDWWIIFLSIILISFTIFIYWTTTYFKNTGIPHQSPWPLVGNMALVIFRKKHIFEKVMEYYTSWPDAKYVGCYDCISPVLIIRDAELIKSISVKNFENFANHSNLVNEDIDPLFGKSLFGLKDDRWRQVRGLLTPAFTANKMRIMFNLISNCAKQFSQFVIIKAKQENNEMEFKDAFTKYTNDVIASCAFGLSVDSMQNPHNEFYNYGKKSTNFNTVQLTKLFLIRFCPTLCKWLNVRLFEPKVTHFFINLIKETIEMRQKTGITRPDMLQLMIEQTEASNKNKFDIVEITAQAFTFFFAGFDTSSSLMSFTVLSLALHSEVQNRLLEEVDQVMKNTNGNPKYEDINAMPYLEAVLYETLRYYPIVGVLDRICTKSFELPPTLPGLKPFVVKRGTKIWFPSYGIHTDSKHYKNPEIYDPNRFFEKKMSTNLSTFIGFGIGPRSCIGNRFAMLENKLVLFYLLTNCKFEKSSRLMLPIEFQKSSLTFTVAIEGGFWIKVVPRT